MDDMRPPSNLSPDTASTHDAGPGPVKEEMSHSISSSSIFLSAVYSYDNWQSSTGLLVALTTALVSYVLLCHVLRFRNIRAVERHLGYSADDRGSLATMTNDHASKILKNILGNEFPMTFNLAMQFAIFKTYGIESISKLLVATKNLTDPARSSKRYEDTTILMGEFMTAPPNSDRALKAISRMNYLHAPYQDAGQISNKDMLYTLAVCITEPIRFIKLYEWRGLDDVERCAIGTFWKSIGDAMGIKYDGCLARAGEWRDGLEFVEDITAWSKAYEIEAMKPANTNVVASEETVRLMLWYVPAVFKGLAEEVLTVLMGERVRDAFIFPEPRILPSLVAFAALGLRRFVIRYLCLPRFSEKIYFSAPDPKTGRIQHLEYFVRPYYNPATLWSRVGPGAWFTWLVGGVLPGAEGMMSDGYLFEEIGPVEKAGKGAEKMETDIEFMKGVRRGGGCPFAGMHRK